MNHHKILWPKYEPNLTSNRLTLTSFLASIAASIFYISKSCKIVLYNFLITKRRYVAIGVPITIIDPEMNVTARVRRKGVAKNYAARIT